MTDAARPGMMMSDGATQPKARTTAAVLAILLGTFGCHRFYLGQPEWGLIYLLLCWTGVPTVVGWVEGAWWLWMGDDAFARKFHSVHDARGAATPAADSELSSSGS